MKKITFIIIALAISAMTFAQNGQAIKMSSEDIHSSTIKSGWEGNSAVSSLAACAAGYQYAIRFTAEELTVNDEITIVKFYGDHENYTSSGLIGTSYTIKIYEGGTFDETAGYDVITANGTEVYSQDYTATVSGDQEVTLTTPYIIGTGEFWVSILCNDNCGVFMGDADPTSAYKYVMTRHDDTADENYWGGNEFCVDAECTSTEFNPWCLSVYVDDGGAYVENSDLYTKFFDQLTAAPYSEVTEATITETEDLVLYPVLGNSGPDATSNTVNILIEVDGNEYTSTDVDMSGEDALATGYFTTISTTGDVTITAAELNTLGATGTFDVCVTATYAGVDNVATNNTACITITRGTVAETTCDLEAVFMTSNTDATPIASTLSITVTEDITVFPAISNNGPDDANTNATVAFIANGTEISSQSIDMTGLTNGSISPLTTSGYLVSAADMNTIGLTGTFDVCMSVTYDGIDNVTANNETCVTVTRGTVNVNTNTTKTISVYPNPANNVVNIANAENSNITVINMVGQVVSSTVANSNLVSINTTDLAEGTYLVRIANGNEVTTQKINVIR